MIDIYLLSLHPIQHWRISYDRMDYIDLKWLNKVHVHLYTIHLPCSSCLLLHVGSLIQLTVWDED